MKSDNRFEVELSAVEIRTVWGLAGNLVGSRGVEDAFQAALLAYAAGKHLISSGGTFTRDRRHVTVTPKDDGCLVAWKDGEPGPLMGQQRVAK